MMSKSCGCCVCVLGIRSSHMQVHATTELHLARPFSFVLAFLKCYWQDMAIARWQNVSQAWVSSGSTPCTVKRVVAVDLLPHFKPHPYFYTDINILSGLCNYTSNSCVYFTNPFKAVSTLLLSTSPSNKQPLFHSLYFSVLSSTSHTLFCFKKIK